MRMRYLHSIQEVREKAPAWDDLWWRSGVTWPTARAELVAMWLEEFKPHARFLAFAVEDQGQLVALLPLVGSRIARYVPIGAFPSSEWGPSGEFLLDLACDTTRAMDLLVAELHTAGWPLIVVQSAIDDARRWALLRAALDRASVPVLCQPKYVAGLVPVVGTWESYRETLSRSHRRKIERLDRQLQRAGELRFRWVPLGTEADVEPLLQRGFEVEDRCWKGAEGTSVLRTPRIRDYYVRQARQLAAWEQAEACFLEIEDRAIAFEYGWSAKGVHHAFKIGYDEAFAHFSPGQQLFYHLLKHLHDARQHRALNCLGPLNQAIHSWRPAAFRVGRMVVATNRTGKTILAAYKRWKRWRQGPVEIEPLAEPLMSPDAGVSEIVGSPDFNSIARTPTPTHQDEPPSAPVLTLDQPSGLSQQS